MYVVLRRIVFVGIALSEIAAAGFALGVFSLAGITHYLFRRKMLFVSFDPETARINGINTGFWNLVFYLVLGATIAVSIRTSGVLLTFGYLVIPAMTALALSRKIRRMFLMSLLISILGTVLGIYASFAPDLPGGVTTVTVLALIFIAAKIAGVIHK